MRIRIVVSGLALLITPAIAESQAKPLGPINLGSKLIAGSAQIARVDAGDGPTITSVSIAPDVLFFVADRFAIGGQVALFHQRSDDFRSTSWQLGPAARYFLAEPNARMLPFVGASVTTGRGSAKSSASTTEFEFSTVSAEGVAGVTRLLSDHVGLTGELFFRNRRQEFRAPTPAPINETRTNEFGLRFGVSAFVF